jgi:hypothetical protein
MEEISKLHPIAQVFAIIGIASFACLLAYNYFKFLRGK